MEHGKACAFVIVALIGSVAAVAVLVVIGRPILAALLVATSVVSYLRGASAVRSRRRRATAPYPSCLLYTSPSPRD